jgi:vitamin B12 transporter
MGPEGEVSFAKSGAAAAAIVLAIAPARAQVSEEVVISAARLGGIPEDLLGSSVSVLEPADLQLRQTEIVSDALRDVPGVAVSRGGGPGQLTQLRIRGAESNHTLVFIDGIKASDPFFGEFDFATLIADDVARIEVLRGEQSALYGSDAIGGVVQYITASGAEASGVRGRLEAGSFGTFDGDLRVAGVAGPLDYALSGAYFRSDGVRDNSFGRRRLGSEIGSAAGKFVYALAANARLDAVLRYSDSRADVNMQDFASPPDATYGFEVDGNGSYHNRAVYGLVSGELDSADGRWRNTLTLQGMAAERDGYGNDGIAADARSSGDRGARERASFVSALDFGAPGDASRITGAIDLEREFYRNTDPTGFADTSARHGDNIGLVGQYDFVRHSKLALGAAVRFDKNYRFADAFTWHLQASYLFDGGFRPHAAAGTGIKNPTIYELYSYARTPGAFLGNPDLKPEKSTGWELGADQRLFGDALVAGATYFHSSLTDEIYTAYVGPNFAASPQNATTGSPREGIEARITARIDPSFRVDLAYTWLRALQNGHEEVRRAPDIAALDVSWRAPADRGGVTLTVRYNGRQRDTNFTLSGPPEVDLAPFTLVDLGADVKLTDSIRLYGRLENLLNQDYQEVYTIHEGGRAVFLGVKAGL